MSKKLLTSVLALTLSMIHCMADANPCCNTTPESLSAEVDQVVYTTVFCTYGGNNPSTRDGYTNGVFATGEFLYWRGEQEGMTFAVSSKAPTGTLGFLNGLPTLKSGETLDLNFEWDPGFRVGLGYNMLHDEWDIVAYWTRLNNDAHAEKSTNIPASLSSTWANISELGPLSKATAHWNLGYNVADIELGRSFFLTRSLSGRPFFGLRGVWIRENFHFHYSGQAYSVSDPIDPIVANTHIGPVTIKGHNNYSAGGLRAGFGMNWRFNSQFSLYGRGSGTLAYGRFHTKLHYETNPAFLLDPVSDTDHFNRVRTNLQADIGLQWETNFNDDKCHVLLAVGYELSEWFDMNQLTWYWGNIGIPAFVPNTNIYEFRRGDLGLQGATATLRFDF